MVNATDKILNKIKKDNRSFEPKSPILEMILSVKS